MPLYHEPFTTDQNYFYGLVCLSKCVLSLQFQSYCLILKHEIFQCQKDLLLLFFESIKKFKRPKSETRSTLQQSPLQQVYQIRRSRVGNINKKTFRRFSTLLKFMRFEELQKKCNEALVPVPVLRTVVSPLKDQCLIPLIQQEKYFLLVIWCQRYY